MKKKTISVIVEGGKASGGPPIGPALGPLGVNIKLIVDEINRLTNEYAGMKVPVEIVVDTMTKEFEVHVKTPTVPALIAKEAKIEKGSKSPKLEKVGNLTLEQILKIAKIKKEGSISKTLKACVKEIIGTCVSMGVTIEGREPREILRDLKEGKYEEFFKE